MDNRTKLVFYETLHKEVLEECRDYIILSRDLGYIGMEQYQQLHTKIEEASKLLNAYCYGIANNHAMNDLDK